MAIQFSPQEILETIRWQSAAHETRTGRGTIPDAILAAAREGKAEAIQTYFAFTS